MISTSDGTAPTERLPNEILEKTLSEALFSSGFSWPNHVYWMNNNLCIVNVRFRDITQRVVSVLPSIFFSDGGELSIVSVRILIEKFGSASGVVLEVQRIIASRSKLGKCLAGATISWFRMAYHRQHIPAKKSKASLLKSALSYPSFFLKGKTVR